MRILNFFDGAQSETAPTIGNITASNLIQYANDSAYEATEQGAPTTGNLYYNTTSNLIRYYTGSAWIDLVDAESSQVLENKTIDGSSTGNNVVQTIGTNVEITPTGNISSSNAADAINELDSEKQAVSEKGTANGYASLDGDGKVPSSQIPPVALSEVFVVADIPARDALTVQEGDTSQTTDTGQWWIYDGSSWLEMVTPAAVTSVNGQTGAVSLGIDDLSDVDTTTSAPNNGEVLTWNGSEWAPAAAGDALESVTTITSTTILTLAEEVVLVDTGLGDVTVSLPTATGNTGKKYRIKKISSDANIVTINGNALDEIDGLLDLVLNGHKDFVTLVCDGSDWFVMSAEFHYEQEQFANTITYSTTADQWGDSAALASIPNGEYDIVASTVWESNGAVTTNSVSMGISTNSGNNDSGLVLGTNYVIAAKTQASGFFDTLSIPKYRVVNTSPTTYYLKTRAGNSTAGLRYSYSIRITRVGV